jgi:hypothetical protein
MLDLHQVLPAKKQIRREKKDQENGKNKAGSTMDFQQIQTLPKLPT